MKKYWNHEGTPVKFDGTKKELTKFEKDNDHLTDEIAKGDYDQLSTGETKKNNARKNHQHMFTMMDKIANWLATENEFGIPADLKSEVMAWQARKK